METQLNEAKMKTKPIAVTLLALVMAVPTQASSMKIEIPGMPFLATANANISAFDRAPDGQPRTIIAAVMRGSRIKFVECDLSSNCKAKLGATYAWVSLERMGDFEHVPEGPVIRLPAGVSDLINGPIINRPVLVRP